MNDTAVSTVKSALGSGWWDRWIVDGLVRFVGGFIKTVSWPIRLFADRLYAELRARHGSRRAGLGRLRVVGNSLGAFNGLF